MISSITFHFCTNSSHPDPAWENPKNNNTPDTNMVYFRKKRFQLAADKYNKLN